MKDTKKYDKSRQLHNEDCLHENRVQLKTNLEVHSISSISNKGRNNVNEYGSDLLEQILSRDNMNNAYKRVKANRGSHGIDGMAVDELLQYLKEHGQELRQLLLEGRYRPQPVKRVQIPKPDGSGAGPQNWTTYKEYAYAFNVDYVNNQVIMTNNFFKELKTEK